MHYIIILLIQIVFSGLAIAQRSMVLPERRVFRSATSPLDLPERRCSIQRSDVAERKLTGVVICVTDCKLTVGCCFVTVTHMATYNSIHYFDRGMLIRVLLGKFTTEARNRL